MLGFPKTSERGYKSVKEFLRCKSINYKGCYIIVY